MTEPRTIRKDMTKPEVAQIGQWAAAVAVSHSFEAPAIGSNLILAQLDCNAGNREFLLGLVRQEMDKYAVMFLDAYNQGGIEKARELAVAFGVAT